MDIIFRNLSELEILVRDYLPDSDSQFSQHKIERIDSVIPGSFKFTIKLFHCFNDYKFSLNGLGWIHNWIIILYIKILYFQAFVGWKNFLKAAALQLP